MFPTVIVLNGVRNLCTFDVWRKNNYWFFYVSNHCLLLEKISMATESIHDSLRMGKHDQSILLFHSKRRCIFLIVNYVYLMNMKIIAKYTYDVYDHILGIVNLICNKHLFKLLGLFYFRKSTIQTIPMPHNNSVQ